MDNDKVEKLLVAMEGMIRALDDMHEENKYSNYREREKIRSDRYVPARDEFKSTLIELIQSIKNTA